MLSRNGSPLQTELWNDQSGFVVTFELILVTTIVVIGLIVGLTALRDAVVSELVDTAHSVQEINQYYQANGTQGRSGSTAGMELQDRLDQSAPRCVSVFGTLSD